MKVALYFAGLWVFWALIFWADGFTYVSIASGLVGIGYLVVAYFRRKEEK